MSKRWKILALTLNLIGLIKPCSSLALPPPEDTPEEILRTEIILEGRSPFNGESLTATEYTELQAQLTENSVAPQIEPDIKQLIFLLQVRKLFKTLIPFF
jgi:hypothetical protein